MPQPATHRPAAVPYTPFNVDGNIPDLFETNESLDPRLILWPHVSIELVKLVMANQLDITKLHTLIPSECRSSLELQIQQDDIEDNTARISRVFGLRDDDEVTKQVKLSKLAKHFPVKETFVAALLVWKGIKLFFGTSLPKTFGPSVDVHIIKMGKLCVQYG